MKDRLRSRPSGPPASQAAPVRDGIGRGSSAQAEAVSDALRRLDSPDLTRRRQAAGLVLGAVGSLGVVAAYQFGLVRKVPEPPLRILDATNVDASGEAYELFRTPDSTLGLASYAVTLALLGMGGADRATTAPVLPLLSAGKAALDVVSSGYLFAEQVSSHRKLCGWCTLAAAASAAVLPLTLPEARSAYRSWRSR